MLALFFHLQVDVHRPGFDVPLQLRIFRLDRVEIAELVQTQDAQFPQPVVEHLPFVQQQFAADHFIARRRVSRELDAPHEKLLLLIEFHGEIHDFFRVVRFGHRLGHEIDVAILAIKLFVVIESLADLRRPKKGRPAFSGNTCAKIIRLENQPLVGIGAAKAQLAHAILLAFVDRMVMFVALPFFRPIPGMGSGIPPRFRSTVFRSLTFTFTLKYPLS